MCDKELDLELDLNDPEINAEVEEMFAPRPLPPIQWEKAVLFTQITFGKEFSSAEQELQREKIRRELRWYLEEPDNKFQTVLCCYTNDFGAMAMQEALRYRDSHPDIQVIGLEVYGERETVVHRNFASEHSGSSWDLTASGYPPLLHLSINADYVPDRFSPLEFKKSIMEEAVFVITDQGCYLFPAWRPSHYLNYLRAVWQSWRRRDENA